jgi:hypothetical protein
MDIDINYAQDVEVEDGDDFDMASGEEMNESREAKVSKQSNPIRLNSLAKGSQMYTTRNMIFLFLRIFGSEPEFQKFHILKSKV